MAVCGGVVGYVRIYLASGMCTCMRDDSSQVILYPWLACLPIAGELAMCQLSPLLGIASAVRPGHS